MLARSRLGLLVTLVGLVLFEIVVIVGLVFLAVASVCFLWIFYYIGGTIVVQDGCAINA